MPNYLDAIPDSESLKMGLISKLFDNILKLLAKKDNLLALMYFVLLLGALILVVCTEPLKILMRKNIGKKALSLLGIIIAALLMFAWVGVIISIYSERNKTTISIYEAYLVNDYVLALILLCYLIFGVYILMRGVKEYNIAKKEYNERLELGNNDPLISYYRGDSVVLNHLLKKGVQQERIWRRSEPWFCFKIGFILTLIHPLLGFPILLMSISFAVNEWYNIQYKWKIIQERQEEARQQAKMISLQYQNPGYRPFK